MDPRVVGSDLIKFLYQTSTDFDRSRAKLLESTVEFIFRRYSIGSEIGRVDRSEIRVLLLDPKVEGSDPQQNFFLTELRQISVEAGRNRRKSGFVFTPRTEPKVS